MAGPKIVHNNQFNYLFYILTTFVVGSLMFINGFFPVSTTTTFAGQTGEKHYANVIPTKLDEYTLQRPSAKYDRIILLIIDALRIDYPNATNMPFANGHACNHLKIKVDIPTVTMPRLKSMTTGTISSFIDIVLNLGHTSKLEDSMLQRLNERNKKSVFAGDRTWAKLFPNVFHRKNINSDSFFVNDFYEGDKNVTKTMKEELKAADWHLMVLHYLGLDHIGHVEGSHSDKIFQKLLEMDAVVEYIVNNDNFKYTLLLVTGDHGMRNGGSHGGSDKEELYVPLMQFQQNCLSGKVASAEYNQIDMAPTLSILLDADIPHTSIGSLIPDLLEIYTKEEQLYFYYYNALHLMEKWKAHFNFAQVQFEDYFSWYTEAKMNHKHFISSQGLSSLSYEKAKQNYIRLSKKITEIMCDNSNRYNMPLIIISLSLTTLSALNLILNILFESDAPAVQYKTISWKSFFACFLLAGCVNCFLHMYDFLVSENLLCTFLITLPITLSIYFACDIFKLVFYLIVPLKHNCKVNFKLTIPLVLLSLFLIHTLSLASSSFIEEEHQTWYYFTPSLLVFLTLQNFHNDVKSVWKNDELINILLKEFWKMRFVLILMFAIIGCRRLNQTGDKWRHLEDIGDILLKENNHIYLTLIFLTGLCLLLVILKKYNTLLEIACCFVALTCVFLYRQSSTALYSPTILVLFWLSVVATALIHYRDVVFYKRKNYGYEMKSNLVELLKANLTSSLLISALLHKPHNVILLPVLMYTLERAYQLCDNLHLTEKRVYNRCYVLVLKTVITIFIANMFYFFQGNSNSLTTIDLNPGYIGLSSYNPFIVGTFITLNTYCAPINAFLYLMWHMFNTQRNMLPLRQEKEQHSNTQLFESTEEDLYLVYGLFTATTIMPVAVYWCLLVGFRYHLFIYSVFAPKAFYECFHLLVFYINFIVTNLYFRLFLK